MHHKVEPLEIMTTTDGSIDLIHVDGFSDDEAPVVHIPVHQVDLVIEWLKEAKTELAGKTQPV